MKTLLAISGHPQFADTIRPAIDESACRVVLRTSVEEAEPLLAGGLADACLLDVEQTGVQQIWAIEKVRSYAPRCPVLVYAGAKQPEWEEEAYLKGADHVLVKPVRQRMLQSLLERLWSPVATMPRAPQPVSPPTPPPPTLEATRSPDTQPFHEASRTLRVMRDFSSVLTHSLDCEAMVKQFLLLLREILSINRATIFLRQPFGSFAESPAGPDSRHLRATCSIGLSASLFEHFELSVEAGIGSHLLRTGRILRLESAEARNDPGTQKEFEILKAQVAVPIFDRETLLGAAVFDGRITGEPLANSELELVFHLLEQLGLAVKNIWLHDQLAGNHEMMAEILRELSSGCVVINRDLAILHANKTARKYFAPADRRRAELEFADLPATLGTRVFQVLKTGAAISNLRYEPDASPGTVYQISIVPFQRQEGGLPSSALLMAEDLTQSEQFKRLEIEAAGLRLVRTMAEKLTNEIGNALVPLAVHQQMLAERLARKSVDLESLKMLERDLAESVQRVGRFNTQMRYLARDTLFSQESFPLEPLIEEACEEARKHQPAKTARIKVEAADKAALITGDRAALKHAISEVLLNAFQANPADPKVTVRLLSRANGGGRQQLQIEVQDNGTGFTAEALQKAPAPFFTTRVAGLGLGLAVTRKILETHHGKLEIVAPQPGQAGVVRISLPSDSSLSVQA